MEVRNLLIAAALFLAACALKDPNAFTIKGEIKGFDGTAVFYATDEMQMGFGMATDSLIFVNGKINYIGAVDSSKFGHILHIDMEAMEIYILAEFIVEPGAHLKIEGDVDWPGQVKGYVTGTVTNDRYAEFQKEVKYMETAGDFTPELRERWNTDAEHFISDNYDNLAGVFVFARLFQICGPDGIADGALEEIEKFSPEMQQHPLLVDMKERAGKAGEITGRLDGTYRDIVSTTPDGKEMKLSETIAANKYTLLDFWASWCGPCIGELPYLREAYAEYSDKGFEIFAVSLDDDGEAWRKSVADHSITWPQVSSLAGWNDPAAKLYGVGSIPASFLFDSEGNIVAVHLRGKAVSEKLAELLP